LQDIWHAYNNRFLYETFYPRAQKDGLLEKRGKGVHSLGELWTALTDEERARYAFKPLDVIIDELPRLRNELAHPASFNMTLAVRSAVDGYWQAIEIISRLWQEPSDHVLTSSTNG
jgi:hypothetical protein